MGRFKKAVQQYEGVAATQLDGALNTAIIMNYIKQGGYRGTSSWIPTGYPFLDKKTEVEQMYQRTVPIHFIKEPFKLSPVGDNCYCTLTREGEHT